MNKYLVLGTAQLGMAYGISNLVGKPSFDTARDIVAEAYDCGIREFDTAQVYGNSEQVLGMLLASSITLKTFNTQFKMGKMLDNQFPKFICIYYLEKTILLTNLKYLEGQEHLKK